MKPMVADKLPCDQIYIKTNIHLLIIIIYAYICTFTNICIYNFIQPYVYMNIYVYTGWGREDDQFWKFLKIFNFGFKQILLTSLCSH